MEAKIVYSGFAGCERCQPSGVVFQHPSSGWCLLLTPDLHDLAASSALLFAWLWTILESIRRCSERVVIIYTHVTIYVLIKIQRSQEFVEKRNVLPSPFNKGV